MKRTTVSLNEHTDLELARLAKQQGRTKAELIREVLTAYVQRQSTPRLLPRSVGMGRSGLADLAEHDEELLGKLYEEKYARIMADRKARQKETQH